MSKAEVAVKVIGQARSGSRRRSDITAVLVGLLTAAMLTASFAGPAAAVPDPSPGTYAGRGFDACDAPTQALMDAWIDDSPYRAVGIYIGGLNRFCSQSRLTASWVNAQRSAGWHLLPIYLGLQPYCTTSNKQHRFTAANAAASGVAEANTAVANASALGLPAGSTIFNDIEAYSTTDSVCRTAVLTFQSAWTARLHDHGFLSGFYSSLGSGVADQVEVYGSTSYVRPDYLWFARYDGIATVSNAAIPNAYWLYRRIKQYRSPGSPPPPIPTETYGGQSLAVDRDQVDVAPLPVTPFGDFTENGWSDLIVRQISSGYLYLYPGNGTRFGSRLRIGTGWNVMSAITRFGDFNQDGHEDLIARENTGTGVLWLYPGTGSGFTPRLKIGRSGWSAMRELTPVGDLSGDGKPDLLAVQTSTGQLYLYPGRGIGFGARRLIGPDWNAMSELTGVGDLNRDGKVDLIARHTATGDLWLYPGTGTSLGARVQVGTNWDTMRELVGVGDFDRDGFNDLVAVQSATGKLFRYPGRGTSFGPRLLIGTSGWTTDLRPLL